jgi:hypothetical protein
MLLGRRRSLAYARTCTIPTSRGDPAVLREEIDVDH